VGAESARRADALTITAALRPRSYTEGQLVTEGGALPGFSTRFQSGFVQLVGLGVADAATWRFAGSNAGLLVAAAVLVLIGFAMDGGEIDAVGAVGKLLARLGGLLSRHEASE
jgi:hypothetical protein